MGQTVRMAEMPTGTTDAPERAMEAADAVVVGGGHNGLITAAYLQRAGMRTVVVEARETVGGTASSERFAGATVNICSCDHITFRATPIGEELDLAAHGLEYLDVEPGQHQSSWATPEVPPWAHHGDVDATLEALGAVLPAEVDGYRRYAAAAIPAARLILAAAQHPPSFGELAKVAARRRFSGLRHVVSWSRRSAADILRSYFQSDAVRAPTAMSGPMVWGVSPEFPGTGLGALTMAMRHVAPVGRPRGGSGALPQSVLGAFRAAGGVLSAGTPVASIDCEAGRVRGVTLGDGRQIAAPVVVSACDPQRTLLRFLRGAPPAAEPMLHRWRAKGGDHGYESKIDAVLDRPPTLRGTDVPLGPTLVIAPALADADRGYHLMKRGEILHHPGLLVNVPSALDPSMAPEGRHVLSLEVLFTPYAFRGGWGDLREPERWLHLFADRCEPGLLDSIVDWRAMTPDVYERDFHLPNGHAASFSGGPLAALRNDDPELTDYETAVPGLYLTGAATFPGAGIWGAAGRNCATVVLARHG